MEITTSFLKKNNNKKGTEDIKFKDFIKIEEYVALLLHATQ